jgi:hypothetical protein
VVGGRSRCSLAEAGQGELDGLVDVVVADLGERLQAVSDGGKEAIALGTREQAGGAEQGTLLGGAEREGASAGHGVASLRCNAKREASLADYGGGLKVASKRNVWRNIARRLASGPAITASAGEWKRGSALR